MKYSKALDGYRGLAILLVLFFHYGCFPAGWIGVQLFFVLSGYLITGILCSDQGYPLKEYLIRFYAKRALRIWPLYYLFFFLLLASFLIARTPGIFKVQWPYLLTYTYNFHQLTPAAGPALYSPLWSLCVEEQFYVLWPFIVYFLPGKAFRWFQVLLIAAGPLLRAIVYIGAPHIAAFRGVDPATAVYRFPTSHFDAFALGALLFSASGGFKKFLQEQAGAILAATTALWLASGAVFMSQDRLTFGSVLALGYGMGGHPLLAYSFLNMAAFGLLNYLLERGQLSFFFENRAAAYIGTISYGMYVWHAPIFNLFTAVFGMGDRLSLRTALLLPVYIAAVVGFSSLSYYLYEKPFLNLKRRFKNGQAAEAVVMARPS